MARPYTHFRFGAPPADGQSWNARDQRHEQGVSCYRLKAGQAILDSADAWSLLRGAIEQRPIFLLRGVEMGRGGDGEPLVQVQASRRAPEGYAVHAPWGVIRQRAVKPTAQKEFTRLAQEWGIPPAALKRGMTVLEILDQDGGLICTYSWQQGQMIQRLWNAYSFAQRGVQALPLPETAPRWVVR